MRRGVLLGRYLRHEKLVGNREGQHSIRINDQYRICFTWTDPGPVNVEIVDYP
ncbi:MAG: type II toxin-antitoxin system RelE/ParE family toxin [Propionibacteriaceae bacterium]|nr:type II toxin-antitoxin system RelE/ParE family toxin [Propionibacteriaceae bacterium]